jgi:putative transposase
MARDPYGADLTDAQGTLLTPLIPPAKLGGRHRSGDIREVLNAIFDRTTTGCQWRNLPHDLPPWGTTAG